jgi:hypothetical protein
MLGYSNVYVLRKFLKICDCCTTTTNTAFHLKIRLRTLGARSREKGKGIEKLFLEFVRESRLAIIREPKEENLKLLNAENENKTIEEWV